MTADRRDACWDGGRELRYLGYLGFKMSSFHPGPGSYCRSMLFIDFSISIDFFFFFFFKTCFQPTASILILCI
jgi:hypothetical protein